MGLRDHKTGFIQSGAQVRLLIGDNLVGFRKGLFLSFGVILGLDGIFLHHSQIGESIGVDVGLFVGVSWFVLFPVDDIFSILLFARYNGFFEIFHGEKTVGGVGIFGLGVIPKSSLYFFMVIHRI